MTPLEALAKVITLCGDSQSELARRIDKSQATVTAWVNRYGRVGPEYVLNVSEAVQWMVTPHQLRPDLYPHPDDGLPVNLRAVQAAA